MPKTYLNLVLSYDKDFQYFVETLLNVLLLFAVFSFFRIIQISAEINISFEVLHF